MINRNMRLFVALAVSGWLLTAAASFAHAQSGATRPRRVTPTPPAATENATRPTPASANTTTPAAQTTSTRNNAATTGNARPTAAADSGAGDTTRAYTLLQQKQYEAALDEAKRVIAREPSNAEAWKLAGFAEVNLNRFAEAATDLQRALELQRAAGEEDSNTAEALARAYVRTEKYAEALPLLVAATTRPGAKPDAFLIYYRGLAEYRTDKKADAERSFTSAVKADPKNAAALYYLGRIAFERQDNDAAVNALNRATLGDARLAEAWTLLTYAYLRRADTLGEGAKADADYLNAVRASEGLIRVKIGDEAATTLHAQALIRAKLYPRATTALERVVAANPNASGATLYLLGFAHSRAKNYPKAASALERAAAKTPDDANIYRELGYIHELTKQYAKALAAYEKGLTLAPDDAYFKESAERVRPFAK